MLVPMSALKFGYGQEYQLKSCGKQHAYCRVCRPELAPKVGNYIEARRRANCNYRAKIALGLKWYLESHPCADCGESDPIVLQFDHVRGTKVKNVTSMTNSKAGAWRELEKCDVVCANCHVRRTRERQHS